MKISEFENKMSYCPMYLAWRDLDLQIDALVYDLYTLTPAEITIVGENQTLNKQYP